MIPQPLAPATFLRQGEIVVTEEAGILSTVLGSCIAFTYFHRGRGLAGMTHALLPGGDGGDRFVEGSAARLLDEFLRRGVRREEIEVKLFGGADMFGISPPAAQRSVGRRNVAAALAFLARENLRLAASDVHGNRGRKIIFHTGTGEVLLQRLPRQVAKLPPKVRRSPLPWEKRSAS